MWPSCNRLKLLQKYRSTHFFKEDSEEDSEEEGSEYDSEEEDIEKEASIFSSDIEVYTWLKTLKEDCTRRIPDKYFRFGIEIEGCLRTVYDKKHKIPKQPEMYKDPASNVKAAKECIGWNMYDDDSVDYNGNQSVYRDDGPTEWKTTHNTKLTFANLHLTYPGLTWIGKHVLTSHTQFLKYSFEEFNGETHFHVSVSEILPLSLYDDFMHHLQVIWIETYQNQLEQEGYYENVHETYGYGGCLKPSLKKNDIVYNFKDVYEQYVGLTCVPDSADHRERYLNIMPALDAYSDECTFLEEAKHKKHCNYAQELHVEFRMPGKDWWVKPKVFKKEMNKCFSIFKNVFNDAYERLINQKKEELKWKPTYHW